MIFVKSVNNIGRNRRFLWNLVKVFFPSQIRFFYEGHPKLHGQLWYQDRKLLYDTARIYKPIHCFEIGTWKGGGSTFFIAQGLFKNRRGKLYTIEIVAEYYKEAIDKYNTYLPHILPYVKFHFGDYQNVYSDTLKSIGKIDFLFLDGAENAEETERQYEFFSPFLKTGTLLAIHDWLTEKAKLIKPQIESSAQWKLKKLLLPPHSVGFALFQKE